MRFNSIGGLVAEIDKVIAAFEAMSGTSTSATEIVNCQRSYKWDMCRNIILTQLNNFKTEVQTAGTTMAGKDALIRSQKPQFTSYYSRKSN